MTAIELIAGRIRRIADGRGKLLRRFGLRDAALPKPIQHTDAEAVPDALREGPAPLDESSFGRNGTAIAIGSRLALPAQSARHTATG